MNELPELLLEAVGDETVVEVVDVGGGDFAAVTYAATHLYRSEGILSDESAETFDHGVDRFAVDAGRRKSTMVLESIDEQTSFTVPSSVADSVVEAMLEGIVRTAGVVADGETIEAQFRFSDLTLVVTDEQLLKHVGGAVWNDEFEAFRYDDLTGLDFEEGSVATQVVVETGGRQQRVKVPNDNAGRVRQDVQSAVFEYHGVSSLGGLRAAIEDTEDDEDGDADEADEATPDDGDGASTGVSDAGSDDAAAESSPDDGTEDGFVSADWSPPADQDITGDRGRTGSDADLDGDASTDDSSSTVSAGGDGQPDVEALAEQVDALAEQLESQTELLETQQQTIEQLVDELRRGR